MSQWRAKIELPVEAGSARVARRLTAELIVAWQLEVSADDAILVASELVANVYRHTPAADSFEFELVGDRSGLRLSVADGSTIKPVIRELDPATPTGRGLRLVQAVASRWGTEEHENGKRVWVHLVSDHSHRLADG